MVDPRTLAEMTAELGRPAEPDDAAFPEVTAPIPTGGVPRRTGPRFGGRSPTRNRTGCGWTTTLLGAVRAVVVAAVSRAERVEAAARSARKRSARTEAAHAETVEDAKALLAERFAERLTLESVAREVHTSPFHLARMFRRRTGFALHEYRTQLRLRAAVDRFDGGDSLAGVAVACGFASHSHLTDAFRRAFGTTPSAFRDLGRRRAMPPPGTRPERRQTAG